MRERQREIERDRQRERQIERQIERERDRQREREREIMKERNKNKKERETVNAISQTPQLIITLVIIRVSGYQGRHLETSMILYMKHLKHRQTKYFN